jgi:hypothetical protein
MKKTAHFYLEAENLYRNSGFKIEHFESKSVKYHTTAFKEDSNLDYMSDGVSRKNSILRRLESSHSEKSYFSECK